MAGRRQQPTNHLLLTVSRTQRCSRPRRRRPGRRGAARDPARGAAAGAAAGAGAAGRAVAGRRVPCGVCLLPGAGTSPPNSRWFAKAVRALRIAGSATVEISWGHLAMASGGPHSHCMDFAACRRVERELRGRRHSGAWVGPYARRVVRRGVCAFPPARPCQCTTNPLPCPCARRATAATAAELGPAHWPRLTWPASAALGPG